MTLRTLDAAPFNAIAVHPEVRPWLGFADPLVEIDLTAQVSNPANFAFLTKQGDGGYALLKLQAGLYAAHTMALPSARGRPMMKLMREGFATMFRATDAVEIVTQVPDGNDGAKSWSELAGFRATFRREAFFPLMGERVGCQFMSLTFADWAIRDRDCLHLGKSFHVQIAAALGHSSHPEDVAHDAMVGAAIGCCMENNAVKGIALYNRWACVAGYAEARIISLQPVVVDTTEAMVQIEGRKLDILSTARSASPYFG